MIVEFLEGTGIDNHGRRLDQVVAEDDEYWDRQNELSQFRRNMEFRRAN